MLLLICSFPARRLNVFVNSFAFGWNLELGEPAPRAAREGQGAPSPRQDPTEGALPPRTPPLFFSEGRFWFVSNPFWWISGPEWVNLDYN